MGKILALLVACSMILTSCASSNVDGVYSDKITLRNSGEMVDEEAAVIKTENQTEAESLTKTVEVQDNDLKGTLINDFDYVSELSFSSIDDPKLTRYIEDTVYSELVSQLNSDNYFIENVEAIYISKEYLDELAYNSQENIYFGYTLSELAEQFQGVKYVFTVDDDGKTVVQELEEYDYTFDKVIKNVATGTGVILLCVTISVLSGAAGVPAISMIFASSAKSATTMALFYGGIGGISAGIAEGVQTKDFNEALKAAAFTGSEGYKWGVFAGTINGGVTEAVALKGATLSGLTMNQAAKIQRESKYPLDVIKQLRNMKQFEICKEAGLTAKMVNGKTALVRNIDLDFLDKTTGLTNLERMQNGMPALDPTGIPYELHHIGQQIDSTLAILTRAEHRLGENHKIWHIFNESSKVYVPGNKWGTQRAAFWEDMAKILMK